MGIFVSKNKKISSEELLQSNFSILSNRQARKILKHLAKRNDYPSNIAETLNINKQLAYYYINKLEKAGIIKIMNREMINGSMSKIYSLNSDSFTFVVSNKWTDFYPEKQVPEIISEFIENGELNAKIVVGSPDPHGPKRQRARDLYYAIDLALFLGNYLNVTEPKTYLDTEIRKEDLKENLICVGGPVSNLVTSKFMKYLPVDFKNRNIFSKTSKKEYSEPRNGFIVKIKNPFNKNKRIMILAGKSAVGTKSAITSLIKNRMPSIVEGIDLDGDGRIDDVEVKENL